MLHHMSYLWRPLSGGAHFTFTSVGWPLSGKSSSQSLGNVTTKCSPFSLFLFLQLLVLHENQGRCQSSSVNLTSCYSLPFSSPACFLPVLANEKRRSGLWTFTRQTWRLGSERSGGCLFKEIRAAALTYSTYLSIVFRCDDEGKMCRAANDC